MIGFNNVNGVLHADNVSCEELANKFGSPAYVYSASYIRQRITMLRDALSKALPDDSDVLIAFACKANSNIAVLSIMNEMELGVDIVSGGEMFRAFAAGVPAERIVFSGVGKSDQEIKDALEHGILQINVESDVELKHIQKIAREIDASIRVVLRYNPDVDAHTHEKITTGKSENKFGLSHDRLIEMYEWASMQSHVIPVGVSMHIGSQLTDIDPFENAFKKMAALITQLRDKGLKVEISDLGGGIGIVYDDETPPDLNAYAQSIKNHITPLGTRIMLEPGRFITGNAGILLTRALYVKKGDSREYAILDAGMNDLMRPSLYDAYHNIRPVHEHDDAGKQTYDVVGPVCETGDTFIKGHEMNTVRSGDLVAIMSAGAYGFVMASNYNTRALPAEILVDGDKYAIIRNRQSIQDIIDEDIVPDWI